MKYVLAPNNVFKQFVLPGEVVEFSPRCTTTAKRLEPAEAIEYGVSVLKMVTPPYNNPLTQSRAELPPTLTAGAWVQTWAVTELFDTQVEKDAALASQAEKTSTQRFADAQVAVQKRLDEFALTRGYDSILSACTYAASTVPKFQSEGQCCVNLRDATWSACYDIIAQVQAGSRPLPSVADVLALMPVSAWPQ